MHWPVITRRHSAKGCAHFTDTACPSVPPSLGSPAEGACSGTADCRAGWTDGRARPAPPQQRSALSGPPPVGFGWGGVAGLEHALSVPHVLRAEGAKATGRGRSSHRARSRRGSRARASKDASKLLLLYDEHILERDPLRAQKDLAFAQAYLTRVGSRVRFPRPGRVPWGVYSAVCLAAA